MIDIEKLTEVAETELNDENLFLVEVKSLPDDEFEIYIDTDAKTPDGKPKGVAIEDCIRLTKAIEARFDREQDDFSLTVSSAGIGQPLKILRQYLKLVGRKVDVTLKTGKKFTATLQAADNESITVATEGPKNKKRGKGGATKTDAPEPIKIPLTEIKTTKEHIDFK